jgi:hypothetical protein
MAALRGLDPSYFALVMGTGIIITGMTTEPAARCSPAR